MRQSFLMNERIYLRAVEPEDMDIMYEMENDPSMWDISNFTVPYSRYVLRQYIEARVKSLIRRRQAKGDVTVTLGNLLLYPDKRQVYQSCRNSRSAFRPSSVTI